MSHFAQIARAAAAWMVAALLAVLVALALGVTLYLVTLIEDSGGVATVAEEATDLLADSLTEAGFGFPGDDLDDPLLASRRIVITESINERVARSVVRKLFYLDAADPSAPIDLYIATVGGWIDPAFAIVDAMEAIEAPVNTIAIGGCHSAGTLILASGTGRRYAARRAIISIHASSGDDQEFYSYDRVGRRRYEEAFRDRAELPDDWYPLTGDRSYYLTPEQALEMDLVDAILGDGETANAAPPAEGEVEAAPAQGRVEAAPVAVGGR